ncbi:MAG: GEVED domain-containing protein [Bacteroidota bacterium]
MKHLSTLVMVLGFSISIAFGQYCIPAYTFGTTDGDSIVSFQLGTINGTLPSNSAGYNDYTNISSTILSPGNMYTASLINNPQWSSGVTLWIDYNQNQIFETTELVAQTTTTMPAGGSASLTFTVPITALPGITRLRMMHQFAAIPNDPCATNLNYGETEDYEIIIPASTSDDLALTSVLLNDIDCGAFGTGAPITVGLANIGMLAADTAYLFYSVNGGTPVADTAYNLASPSLNTFTFTTLFPIAPNTTYDLVVWTSYAPDTISSNDTIFATYQTPNVFTFPYLEDFESFTVGSPGNLANGWSRNTQFSTIAFRWQPDDFGTTTFGTGPSDDHSTIGSKYMYTESSSGGTGDATSLVSPCISLTGSTAPRLSFWYHMFGSTMGDLQVYVVTGGTQTLVWSISGEQQTSDTDDWLEGFADLTAFAGQVISLEFRGVRGNGITSDMAIDDVSIFEPTVALDVGATAIIDPVGAGCISGIKDVLVEVTNFGNDTLDLSLNNVTITVDIDGPTGPSSHTAVLSSGLISILGMDTALVSTTADFSVAGVYTITAYTSLLGDTIVSNDTIVGTAESLPVVTSFLEDFETFAVGNPGLLANGWTRVPDGLIGEGWIVDDFGTGSFGTGPADDHTDVGSIYMYIESSSGSTGNQYSLISPCIDLTGATAPRLSFWYHMFGLNMGTLEVYAIGEVSDTLLWTISGQQQISSIDPWKDALVDLTPFVGQTIQLEFRNILAGLFSGDMALDDINVFNPPPIDAAAVDIDPNDVAACFTSSESVTVYIRNDGNQTLDFSANNATVTLDITGASTQNFSTTVTSGTVAVLDSFPVVVTTTADLTGTGIHNFMATVALAGDTIAANDTTLGSIESLPVFSAPFTEDFETFTTGFPGTLANGWTFGNTTGYRWQVDNFGTGSGGTGPADDHTATGSIYMYTEASTGFGDSTSLFSPCIDLTGLTTPRLSFWYHMFGAAMGTLKVQVLSGGTSTQVWSLSGQQQSADTDPWQEAIIDLTAFAGQSIQLEFEGLNGPTFTSDMAIDDVQILQPAPIDGQAMDVVPNGEVACYSSAETVSIIVRNTGSQPLDFSANNMTVTLDVTGASTQNFSTTVTSGIVPVLGTISVDVTTTADFTATGFHNFNYNISIVGDTVPANDASVGFVESLPVFTAPFTEDFETFTTGFPGIPANGWTFNANDDFRWQVDNFGTGSFNTGPADDHTAAGSIYMYTESNFGALAGDSTSLFSPCLDLTSLTAPRLSFWYHMFGADMGTLSLYAIDGGTTPSLLFTQSGQVQTADSDPWIEQIIDLTAFAGQSIQLEFRGHRGISILSDMAIDDVNLVDPDPVDASAINMEPNGLAACLSAAESVDILVRNVGSQTLDFAANNLTVSLDVMGASTQNFSTTVTSGTLAVLDTLFVTVTTNADFSATGFHNMTASVSVVGDNVSSNDTTLGFVESLPVFTAPYTEDFETFTTGSPGALANGWTRTDDNFFDFRWQPDNFGTGSFGTGPADDHTAIGSIYMYTEASSGITDDSTSLFTPCIDLSGMSAPRLSFWYHMFGTDMGTMDVYALDGTTSTLLFSQTGQVQSSEVDPWIEGLGDLSQFAGQTIQLEFRGTRGPGLTGDMAIDDVNIFDPPPLDIGANALSPTGTGCYPAVVDGVVTIINLGNQPLDLTLNPVTVMLDVTGPTPQNFSTVVNTGVIPVFGTLDVTVTTALDLTTGGSYSMTGTATMVGDTLNGNDSFTGNIQSIQVVNGGLVEDFETFVPGNGQQGTPGTFMNSWTSDGDNNANGWNIHTGPTGSTNTGPIGGNPATNSQIYLYTETSGGGLGDRYSLYSPCVDLSSQTAPNLYFSYHMFGVGMGILEVHVHQNGVDNMIWSVSGQQHFTDTDPWTDTVLDLSTFTGDLLQVEFRGFRGNSFTSDMAIDDIGLYELLPQDGAVPAIFAPGSSCGLGDSMDIVIAAQNFGTDTLIGVSASVQVNGGSVVTLSVPDTILPGAFIPFFFPGNDFSAFGDYDIKSWTNVNGDTNFFNDTSETTISSIPTISTYPYFEDFESGNGGWIADQGTAGSWAFGTPAKNTIIGASSGVNAWVTGGLGTDFYNPNDSSQVVGPCFDFTSNANPAITLDVWWNSEFSNDGAVLQSSIDNGATWQDVGAFGDPNNWYNDNTLFGGAPGGSLQGWTGRAATGNGSDGWVEARHALTGLGGQASVLLRVAFGASGFTHDDGFAFDNILIYEIPDEDLGVTAILDPVGGFCTGDTVNISVLVENFGVATQTSIPVTVDVTGPQAASYSVTSSNAIIPGASDSIFVASFTAAVAGDYTFTAYTDLGGDTLQFNDTTGISNLITITQTAAAPTVISDSICATDSSQFTLIATSAATDHRWYDSVGGSVIHVGDTFNTPFLTSSNTYFVEAVNPLIQPSFTPVDNSFGPGGNANFNAGLRFDVFMDLVLHSVKVYPNGPGNIVVNLEDNTGAPLQTVSIPFGGTVVDTVVTLDWEIAPGLDYVVNADGQTTGGLFRNFNNNTAFPYTLPGVISVTNAESNNNFYYFFYDWQVIIPGCPSPLVPVNAAFKAPAQVDLGPDGTVCAGAPIDAFDPTLVSYVWNGDPSVTTSSITADTTGLYYVDVVNNEGCDGTDSVILIVNPVPLVDIGPDDSECDSVVLDAGNPGASYVWTGPGGMTGSDQTFTATETGTYSVLVTALGCPNGDSADIVIFASPAVDLGPDRGTCEPVMLDAGSDGVSYLWSTGATTQMITAMAPIGSPDTITVEVTSADGCITNQELILSEGTPPVFDLGAAVEECDSALITGPVIDGATYAWSTGETTSSIYATTAGTFSLTVTDSVGCEATDSVFAEVEPTPVADATFSNPNFDFTINFVNLSTPATGATYFWDFGDGGTDTVANPVYTYTSGGSWPVKLIVTNACGTDSVEFIVGGVDIDNDAFGSALSVYPNPTKDEVFISSDNLQAENLKIEVLDARGRLVVDNPVGQVFGSFLHIVDLEHEAEGVYMIKISDGERTAYKRVMKE